MGIAGTGEGYEGRGHSRAGIRVLAMAELTIWHNPNCSTSKFAVERAEDAGVQADLRKYMLKAQRPSRDEIVELIEAARGPGHRPGAP